MKKKTIGYIAILIILCFTMVTYYKQTYSKLESENKIIVEQVQAEELPHGCTEEINGNSEADQQGTDKSTASEVNISLHALSAALVDGASGRVLYEKNGNKILPMASTTKIMTCIVALENSKPDEVVTVSKYASTMPDVQLTIRPGEQYLLEDLLYSLMLESHNDVAVAIAEHVGGSVEGFAKMMNDKARELGCEHTNFVTPNGLDAEGHSTTAVELAKIAGYAIKNKEFIKITNTPSRQFTDLAKKRSFSVTNKDKFLYMYDGAIGVKTGFTGKAGYCFVGAVEKDNRTFISSVLGSGWPPNRNFKWSDTTKLMDYGVKHFNLKTIFDGINDFKTVLIEKGLKKTVSTYVEGNLELLMKEDDRIQYAFNIPESLVAPVHEGNIVGYLNVTINNESCAEFPIKIAETVERIDYKYCIDQLIQIFLFR